MRKINLLTAFFNYSLTPLLAILLLFPGSIFGQSTDESKEDNKTVTPLVDFTSTQKSDNTIDLRASYKAKIEGVLTKLPGLGIRFYTITDSGEKELGEVLTDRNGVAIFNCKAGDWSIGGEGKLHFKAVFAGNKSIEASEEEIAIKRAFLAITAKKEDSVFTVQLLLTTPGENDASPVSEITLGVFVKRMFYPLKLGEGVTDDKGEASVEIPSSIPGDSKGNIVLLAKLEDNEDYGNLEAAITEPWGQPVSDRITELPRALWSPHPPMWMLITFIVLMTAVWGHYIVILYELFRLRKEHPQPLT